MTNPKQNEITEFLRESNAIEGVRSFVAQLDSKLAFKYALSVELLSAKDILEIHRLLMNSLRPDIAGQYRRCAVMIGDEIKKYRGAEFIESQLTDLTNDIIASFKLEDSDREKACISAHVAFENIHPFEDGNGRVGRIIYNWHRLKLGLPLHIIHEGEEQNKYYEWFRK